MPITPFLNGERFDPESRRVLSVAFEMLCIALRTGDCDEAVKQAIATKLIALLKAGERNPDMLCEEALKDMRYIAPKAPVHVDDVLLGDAAAARRHQMATASANASGATTRPR